MDFSLCPVLLIYVQAVNILLRFAMSLVMVFKSSDGAVF